MARAAHAPLLLKAVGRGRPLIIDGQRESHQSRCLGHEQQTRNALMSFMQPLVIGFSAAPAVADLLRQEAVVVAVVLAHYHRQLRRQVFIDDQLDVGRFIKQYPTAPCAANQLALGLYQHGNHVAAACTFRCCAVQILSPEFEHGVDVLNQSKAPRSSALAGLSGRPSYQAFCRPKGGVRF